MQTLQHATSIHDARLQLAAGINTLVAQSNAAPEDAAPVTTLFERVLDIASYLPGGQQALVDGLLASASVVEVVAFCRSFVHTFNVAATMDECNAVHDDTVPA